LYLAGNFLSFYTGKLRSEHLDHIPADLTVRYDIDTCFNLVGDRGLDSGMERVEKISQTTPLHYRVAPDYGSRKHFVDEILLCHEISG